MAGSSSDVPPPVVDPTPQPNPLQEVIATLRGVVVWLLVALALRWLVVEPRWIPSGSMLPTLQLEDRVLVQKILPRLGVNPGLGDIVVFHPPPLLLEAGYDPKAALIKRVVAVAGDRVEVRDGLLWRNGRAIDPDWSHTPATYTLAPQEVPPGHLMVLGDNRNASLDSHVWGPLPGKEVIGTAFWRYWPLDRFGPLRFSAPEAREWKTSQVG
ncbi:MAG: signal peptidase I [Cyanobacteriota bacterium]|jgi:signal peptidase I